MLLRAALLCVVLSVCLSHVTGQQETSDNSPNPFVDSILVTGANYLTTILKAGCRRCPRECKLEKSLQFICTFTCNLCTVFKRSVQQPNGPRGHLTPMPNKFSAYDLNDDGVVSMKELAFVAGQGTDIKMVFDIADKDGDKKLTPQELYNGPFVFEMDVDESDYMYCHYMAKRRGRHG